MKKILIFLTLLVLLSFEVGWGYGIVTNTATRDSLSFPCNPLDSLGSPVNLASGDSIYVMVIFPGGAVAYRDSMAWDDASILRLGWEDFAETTYVFMERVSVIDGAGVDGLYRWFVKVQDLTGAALTTQYVGEFQIVNSTLESSLDSAGLSAVDVQNIDAWDPILDNDSLIIDQSTLIALKPTTAGRTLDVTATGEAGLDLDNTVGTLSKTEIPYLAHFDSLVYRGPRGMGVYLDSAAANTNTVVGTDGTCKNPVSTLVAARTLVDALGCKRYYFLNASTFNGATVDLAADHQNFEFIGIGNNNEMAFGGQRVDGSRFGNMTLSGAMHASGGDVLYTNCILGYISSNFNGHADNCWLTDTIVMKVSKDIEFSDCQSGVAGNKSPTVDMTGGSSTLQIRNYSGGIRVMNGSSSDTISVETDGQVIISANNTSLNITLRGMLTPTDSGTTTNLTDDAVFSRQDALKWIWSNIDTTASIDTSDLGNWLSTSIPLVDSIYDSVKVSATTITNVRSYMDTLIYAGRVWLDGAASNTNTVVGTDGTRSNPVSTIAAATTVATSLGIQRIYLVNSTSITLAQTYNGWEFIGIGINNTINFGGQDVDKSYFERVTVSGIQGGTSMIYLECCGINGADSLEVLAENCWIMGANSVKQATDITFNQCKSAVAGAGTPSLSFNSAPGTVNVKFRHYSGGLEVLLMTTNHTMSFEGMGQFIINANCTSANLALRGLIFVTNNGTTTNFLQNKDAVFSRQEAEFWVWANADTAGSVDTSDIGDWLTTASWLAAARSLTELDEDNTTIDLDGTTIGTATNLTTNNDKTGYSLVATEWEEVWRNIDTTNVDTSDIGTWLSTGIAASLSDANMGAIADSVWDKLYADAVAVAGGIGDTIQAMQGWLAHQTTVDSLWDSSVSITTAAANISDSVWDKDTVDAFAVNGSVGSFIKDSLPTVSLTDAIMGAIADSVWDKDTTDAFAIAAGVGKFVKDSTVSATASIADADMAALMDSMSNRGIVQYDSSQAILQLAGITVTATANNNAVTLAGSGTGEGLKSTGGTTGHAFELIGGSSTGNALRASTATSQAAISAVSTTGPGIYTQGKYGLQAVGQTSYGILVEGSKVSGDSAGIAAVSGGTDPDFLATLLESEWEKVWYNIDTTNIDTSDLGTWFSTGISASLSDANMGAIADSVWDKDTVDAFAIADGVGQFVKDSTVSAAATIVDADMAAIMDSMSNRGIVQYDSSQAVLQLSGLYIIATPGGESTAVEFQGDGAGHGFYTHGDRAANAGNTGYGSYSQGAFNGIYGILGEATADNGRAIGALSSGASAIGVYIEGQTTGMQIYGKDTSGYALLIESDGGDGVVIWPNKDSTGASKHGIEIQTWGAADDGIRILTYGATADGISVTSTNAQDIDATLVNVDTVDYTRTVGSVSSVAGSGSNVVTIYAVDTIGEYADPPSGTAKMDVKITVASKSGSDTLALRTNSSGYVTFNLDADTFFVTGSLFEYAWDGMINDRGDTLIVTGTQTDSLLGREIQVSSSALSQTCDVTVQVAGNDGNPAKGIKVTAYLDGSNLADSAGHGISNRTQSKKTDVNGNVTFSCVWSSYIVPATKWKFTAHLQSGSKATKLITVPRQASLTLDF